MPLNKSALIRYQALDRCFSDLHRKYYFDDLIDACQEALSKLYDKKETVSRRSLFYDMAFMASEHGYNAPIEHLKDGTKKYYRYRDPSFTINRQPLNDLETSQLKEALGLLSRLSGRHEFTLVNDLIPKIEKFLHLESSPPIISYEENKDLKNHELLGEVFNAIRDQRVLSIHYHSFKSKKPEPYTLHPYFLKQYNTRWFVFGYSPQMAEQYDIHPVNFALDRIEKISYLPDDFVSNQDIDFDTYFDDIIGVTKPKGVDIAKIMLRITKAKMSYIATKPIHMSQKRMKSERDAFTTSIQVIPNYELYALLLSLGPEVEVLEPKGVREELKRMVEMLGEKYGLI